MNAKQKYIQSLKCMKEKRHLIARLFDTRNGIVSTREFPDATLYDVVQTLNAPSAHVWEIRHACPEGDVLVAEKYPTGRTVLLEV